MISDTDTLNALVCGFLVSYPSNVSTECGHIFIGPFLIFIS
uniref:Uncharacterized protein n=1 Tax=Anguilla anguilla TaxID=7936 RepID=A0A0E9RER5_ANGAN